MATSGRPSTVRAGGDRAGNRGSGSSSGGRAAMDAGGPEPALAVNGGAPAETAAKLEKMLPAGCSPGVIGECDYDSTSADYYFNSYAHFGMCVTRYALVGGRGGVGCPPVVLCRVRPVEGKVTRAGHACWVAVWGRLQSRVFGLSMYGSES